MNAPLDLSLYFVTDTKATRGRDWLRVAAAAVQGGVSVVQLRDKDLADEALVAKARALQDVLRPRNIPLIVNDNVAVALAVGAAGVHLGSRDMDPREARRRLGRDATIGLSIEQGDEVPDAVLDAVDYIAASPVFPSATKTDAGTPWGLDGLRRLRARYSLPLVAIGSIDADNLEQVLCTGVDGVALVRAVRDAHDVCAATQSLRATIGARLRARVSRVLTIAGSDSGGGAGIQADLKTFQALGAFGMSAVTAVTAQNTVAVTGVHALPPPMVAAQIEAVANDIGVDAVKIGMLSSLELVETVADCVERLALPRVVLDPVMVAKGGQALLRPDALRHLVERLFPLADVVTPNLPEAEAVLQRSIGSEEEMEEALGALLQLTKRVVLKGGHLNDTTSSDLFGDDLGRRTWVRASRVRTRNTHGTGCTFSSAIAAYAARGLAWEEAIERAKQYLTGAVAQGARSVVGHGHGPVAHAWNLREAT